MRLTQPILRSSITTPNKIAIYTDSCTRTFSEFKDRVAKTAAVLQKIGAKENDRIGILSLNSDLYHESFFAIPWAGSVMVPLNTRWSAKENIYASDDAGISILLVDDTFLAMGKQMLAKVDSIQTLVYLGKESSDDDILASETLIRNIEPMEDAGRGYDDLAGIFYTGGTTGFPKGVMLSHQNLVSNAMCNLSSLGINVPDAIYLHAAPMFHVADVAISLATTFNGNAHAFIPNFTPAALIDSITTNSITHVLLVPTMISILLSSPEMANADLSSLQSIYYGASPMTEGTLISAMKEFPTVNFYQAYGQTEMSPVITVLGPDNHCLKGPNSGKLRSAGQCNIGCEIKIIDDKGNTLPIGKVGEITATGPNLMQGYWNNPKQTKKAIIDGWVLTGDAGYLDEDGFLFLVDRKKDMIVTGGENVFSAEVENALSMHPAINEAVVIGIPSEKWGEAVHAIVRLHADVSADEKEIIAFCKQNIAGYKCPQKVEFRDEPFPITGAGKIRKNDIRDPYWADCERKVN